MKSFVDKLAGVKKTIDDKGKSSGECCLLHSQCTTPVMDQQMHARHAQMPKWSVGSDLELNTKHGRCQPRVLLCNCEQYYAHANRPSYHQSGRPCNAVSQLHVCAPQAASSCLDLTASTTTRKHLLLQYAFDSVVPLKSFILSYSVYGTEAPGLGSLQDRHMVTCIQQVLHHCTSCVPRLGCNKPSTRMMLHSNCWMAICASLLKHKLLNVHAHSGMTQHEAAVCTHSGDYVTFPGLCAEALHTL